MANRPTLMLIPLTKKDDINAVWAARGLGSGNFYKTASPGAGGQPTHTYVHDASMNDVLSFETVGLSDNGGTPPDISGNTAPADTWLHWFPNEANENAARAKAKAACAALQASGASENWNPQNQLNGLLNGEGLVADEIEI